MARSNRVAIVTGASRGIGADVAARLASDNLHVVVNYRSDEAAAGQVVEAIRSSGGTAECCRADVSDAAQARGLFDFAEQTFGPVDVIINNAGILTTSLLAETTNDQYARLVATNLVGSFNCMREAAMRLKDGGRIINLSSSAVATAPVGLGVYVATKAAVEALTQVLAKELGSRRITVNAIAPGAVATELFRTRGTKQQAEAIVSQIPLGRIGEPGDISEVVAFLASPQSGWINGQVLRVNGGRI